MKKDFYEFISGLNTAEERINQLEDRLIEIIQTEKEKQYKSSSSNNNDDDNNNNNNSKRKEHTKATRHYQKALHIYILLSEGEKTLKGGQEKYLEKQKLRVFQN